jgi:transcriptional regulator with XRE-family HTH domain
MEHIVRPDELCAAFRDNLRARRLELGITQTELAERIQAQQPYIAALERGERSPTLPTLAKLAIALQTTPEALLRPGIFSALGVDK